MRRLLFCLPAVALVLAACRGDKDPVLARVGKLKITRSEFQRKIGEVAPGYQEYVLTPSGRRQFLDVLIREKLMLGAAQASEVPRSAEYRERLERLKRDEAERVREGGEALLAALWIESLKARDLRVSDAEVGAYLEKYPAEVELRHVLLAEPDRAAEVARRLRGGADFAKVAKQESLDAGTAAAGGKFPPMLYGEIIPELEEIALRLRPGEVGGPLKSKFGYHVLRKERERGLSRADAATRERVRGLLARQKLDGYLKTAQDKFPVEVVDEQLK